MGFIYRIYLSRSIGPEGVGIYQIALTVFGLLLTIVSSGIPITVSRMLTKYKAEGDTLSQHSTATSGIALCLIASIPIVLIFTLFKSNLSFIFSDKRCMDVFTIILPGLIITSVYAVIRGYFWGNKDFLSYSIIELLEEAVMLIAGILLVSRATSETNGALKAGWAVLISYIFSFTASSILFFIKGGRLKSTKQTLKPLLMSSAPITAMRTATSFINSLIAVVLPARLVSTGLTSAEAVSQFGEAFGMALPILFMPGTLIGSLAVVLVPELSENYYKNQKKNLVSNIEKALKFSIFIAGMILPILLTFGKSLGIFFYDSNNAGKYLTYFSPAILPMSLCMISTSILNSLNLERKTLKNYLWGAIFMTASIFLLPKYLGIYSLAVGLLGQFTITAAANLLSLDNIIKANLSYLRFALKTIIFVLPSAIFGSMLNKILTTWLGNTFACIIGCTLTAGFTFLLYIVFGTDSKIFLNDKSNYGRNKKL